MPLPLRGAAGHKHNQARDPATAMPDLLKILQRCRYTIVTIQLVVATGTAQWCLLRGGALPAARRAGGLREFIDMLTRFLGVLLLSVAGAVSGSDVYRSVDENGNVTYASQPVQDAVETTPVRIESGPSVRQLREANEH
jgi:hypothetical protein